MDLAYLISQWLPPVEERIFTDRRPKDFVALSRVSKDIRDVLEYSLRSSCYNINAKLFRFFNDPKAFRQVQARTGAIIGGDFAWKFFANQLQDVPYEIRDPGYADDLEDDFGDFPTDLQVYVQYEHNVVEEHLAALSEYLESDGWSSCAEGEGANLDEDASVDRPRVYQKKSKDGRYLRIYLPLLHRFSHRATTPLGPTTAAITFITWNKACSPFPRTTFIKKIAYPLTVATRKEAEACKALWDHIDIFREYGVTTLGRYLVEVKENEVTGTIRHIGDEHTWTISLDTSCLEPITAAR